MSIATTWTNIKNRIDNNMLVLQYVEKLDRYHIFIDDRNVKEHVILWKSTATATGIPINNITELTEFETSYKAKSNKFTPQEFAILEENTRTGGHYQAQSFDFDIPATIGWHEMDVSYPIGIGILNAENFCRASSEDDEVQILVSPNTTVGATTSDVSIADIIINVQSSVTSYMEIGYIVILTDGINTNNLGRCINIDKNNNQLTVEVPVTNAFTASSPTYVQLTNEMVRNKRLTAGQRWVIGEGKIGASYIKENTLMRIRYNNKTATPKVFILDVEYLY